MDPRRGSRISQLLLVSLLATAAQATAQPAGGGGVQVPANSPVTNPQQPSKSPEKSSKSLDPSPVQLSREPFRLDSIGLTILLPEGATVQANRVGERNMVDVIPDVKDRTWIMSIQTPQTTNPKVTIKESADQTVALLQGAVGITDPKNTLVLETDAKLLERTDNLQLKGGPSERLYVSLPAPPGGKSRLIKGYTIFKPSPTQFVVFELVTSEPEFAKAKRAYETCVATAEFADPGALMASRGAAVKAGEAVLASLTAADFDAVCDGKERWYRLFKPAPGGGPQDAEEIGYRGVRFWKGKRGEIDTRKTAASFSRTEQQEGHVARLRVRLINGTAFIDTTATYFMTPDRKEEAWMIQMVQRDAKGRDLGAWTEIGARDGNDLKVSVEQSGQPGRIVSPLIQGEGYLSQFEAYALPMLLIRKGAQAEFGFYAYRSATESISLRKDTLQRETANNGAWTLRTEFHEDSEPQVSIYNEKGELIRTDLGEGRLCKLVSAEELFELWRSKGLPTGATK